jgi:hypothetical protein
MLQLSEIWIYPIKSLGGISLTKALLTDRGLQYDRRWMLVTENGIFISQREYPKLALFKTEISDGFLEVTFKENNEKIKFELKTKFDSSQNKIQVSVWDDVVKAIEVSQEVSIWFTKQLGVKVFLVFMPDDSHRKVDSNYAITGNEVTSFSDGYPFLIIGQSSLDNLNSKLTEKVKMNRFRPNFVFKNGNAFEEEKWREFQIGNISFVGLKPCFRCIVTTIDQENGIISGNEPLKTLASYRSFNNKVLFGQNVIATNLGSISIGDKIKINSRIL